MFSDSIITNFLLILTVKYNLENRSIFSKVKVYKNCANVIRHKRCSVHGNCRHGQNQRHNRSFGTPDCSTCCQKGRPWPMTLSKNNNQCRWRSMSLNGHTVRVIVVCCVAKFLRGPFRFFWMSFAVLWSFAVFNIVPAKA